MRLFTLSFSYCLLSCLDSAEKEWSISINSLYFFYSSAGAFFISFFRIYFLSTDIKLLFDALLSLEPKDSLIFSFRGFSSAFLLLGDLEVFLGDLFS